MSLPKKSFAAYLKITLTSVVLFSVKSVAAEIKPNNTLSGSNLNKLGQIKFTPSKDSKIHNNVAVESSETGVPSLRRQPTGGEKFEPKRIPLQVPFPKPSYRTSPSITIINPSGYGASWGSAGVGLGYQERARFREESDGVIGLGFGLGNPRKNIGAQIGISLVDVSAPFRDGGINIKLHRRLPKDFSVCCWGSRRCEVGKY